MVVCQNSQGTAIHAGLLHLTRYLAVFEIYTPVLDLRVSERLSDFKIVLNDRVVYSGTAVVSNLVNSGAVLVCEAKLDESGFTFDSFWPSELGEYLRGEFSSFLGQWQNAYKVLPEFKVIMADMQTFLTDLRLWLDQVELAIRGTPSGDRHEMERQAAEEAGREVVPAFNSMHERLEALSAEIEEGLRPVHQSFSKRQLHPLMLCSPFAYRTYWKPLGYAGDYEAVDMILRDPYEGASLFAKVVNLWFLSQWPAKAHRNRIQYLKERLIEEAARGARRKKPVRVLSLGCGPAREIQQFLENELSEYARFTLLDFNDETIQYANRVLGDLKRRFHRSTPIQLHKKSVAQVLKAGGRAAAGPANGKYDFIYCAGVFDYLSERTCKQLMNVFYEWLEPGGLLVATNVQDCKPFRHMLEFVLDWHLVYRDEKRVISLVPDDARVENLRVKKDVTGVNLFLEIRKPDDA